jgi:cobalt-zinc-cadmium efflux system membrane fusion protein
MTNRIILSFVLILLFLTNPGCNNRPGQATKDDKEELKTYKVTAADIQTYIEATGSVQPDLAGTAKVLPQLAGVVSNIFVKVGDRVEKGDPLVTITSPDVTDTFSNYFSNLTQLKQTERIYNLNKELFQIGAITKNDLLNSEATYNQLNAVSEGLKHKLRLYGYATDGDALKARQDTVLIKAPMSGVITDIQTHAGDRVDTAALLMTVADPQSIVIVANIYDTDIAKVKKGSNVTFYVDAFPSTPFKGIITYVSDVSDIDSKTVKTFIRILDKKDLFKQNMFLKLKIEGEKRRLPLIPQSAMVYRDGKFYVYCPKSTAKQQCELKEIKPVTEVSGKQMAVEGLQEGDEIVLTAIDLERP